MKPIKLQMTGFLSYRDTAELNFEEFDLACISGNNGAGKSSILDAMTFALFGKARKNDSSLINSASEKGEVILTFEYEGLKYRIIRRLFKNKPFELDFQIFDQQAQLFQPISDSSRRKTEDVINQTLGLDYETFINASFFLQGEADSFTQKRPTERKEILGKILGLEKWDIYKDRTLRQKRSKESEHRQNELTLREIEVQLAKEAVFVENETTIKNDLADLSVRKKTIQTLISQLNLEKTRRESDEKNFNETKVEIDRLTTESKGILAKIDELERQQAPFLDVGKRKSEIEEKFNQWKNNEQLLDRTKPVEAEYRKLITEKIAFQAKINQEEAILRQKIQLLQDQEAKINDQLSQLPGMKKEYAQLQLELIDLNTISDQKINLDDLYKMAVSLGEPIQKIEGLHDQIKLAKANLEKTIAELKTEKVKLEKDLSQIPEYQKILGKYQNDIKNLDRRISEAKIRDDSISKLQQMVAIDQISIKNIHVELEELIDRRDHLYTSHEPYCNLCEQSLTESDRHTLVQKLDHQIIQKEGAVLTLTQTIAENHSTITELNNNPDGIEELQKQKDLLTSANASLSEKILILEQQRFAWDENGAVKLDKYIADLTQGNYAKPFQVEVNSVKQSMLPKIEKLGLSQNYPSLNELQEELSKLVTDIKKQTSILEISLKNQSEKISDAARLKQQIDQLQFEVTGWQRSGAKELEEKKTQLERSIFAEEIMESLKQTERKLDSLNFDQDAYIILETKVKDGRLINEERTKLITAETNLNHIAKELADKKNNVEKIELQIARANSRLKELGTQLAAYSTDPNSAVIILDDLSKVEAIEKDQHQKLGEVQLLRKQIDLQKHNKHSIEITQAELASEIRHLTALETAFGTKGIPTMLIEQAIPNIEEKANQLLNRLTDGTMSVRIQTQSPYADKNRGDLKETLEIHISDGSGYKEYEMYSGGEAFRVNFAIRLALSEVLTSRKNAKLQTLVIDEGFGSQDIEGREKLKQCINIIKNDFAKILIITHLDDLKEAFPNRIEIEKSHGTSIISVN